MSRYEKRKSKDEIYPLVENKIIEADILEWAKNVPQFHDYYKFNTRCGCMYCPLSSMENMAYLLLYYPKEYERFMKLARQTELMREEELGRPFSVFSSNPKYNTPYRDERIRKVYVPKLQEKIMFLEETQ